MKFELGAKVKDKTSPFAGTVVGRHEYLNSSTQYTVRSEVLAPSTGRPVEEYLGETAMELADSASTVVA